MFPRTQTLAAVAAAWLAIPAAIAAVQDTTGEAAQPQGTFCGGIAAFQCPEGQTCVDDPNDTCDPDAGGADCGGICVQATNDAGQDATKPRCGYSDPNQKYVSQDPERCAAIRFMCEPGFEPFFNDCGCGCQPVAP